MTLGNTSGLSALPAEGRSPSMCTKTVLIIRSSMVSQCQSLFRGVGRDFTQRGMDIRCIFIVQPWVEKEFRHLLNDTDEILLYNRDCFTGRELHSLFGAKIASENIDVAYVPVNNEEAKGYGEIILFLSFRRIPEIFIYTPTHALQEVTLSRYLVWQVMNRAGAAFRKMWRLPGLALESVCAMFGPNGGRNNAPRDQGKRIAPVSVVPTTWKEHLSVGYPVSSSSLEITAETKVCAMGSCFANEIRNTLMSRGLSVYPTGNRRAGMFFLYTPMSLLQEARLAFGEIHRQATDVWSNPEGTLWQDPYRRYVIAPSESELHRLSVTQDQIMLESFMEADAFIFTLGHIEAWRLSSGFWACIEPTKPRCGSATFQLLTFDDCVWAIRSLIHIIRKYRPAASITFTISPVPFFRTYRPRMDVSIANVESKSTLRAALGQVLREDTSLHYFPAYEFVIEKGGGAFKEDRKHIRAEIISEIIDQFVSWHVRADSKFRPSPHNPVDLTDARPVHFHT